MLDPSGSCLHAWRLPCWCGCPRERTALKPRGARTFCPHTLLHLFLDSSISLPRILPIGCSFNSCLSPFCLQKSRANYRLPNSAAARLRTLVHLCRVPRGRCVAGETTYGVLGFWLGRFRRGLRVRDGANRQHTHMPCCWTAARRGKTSSLLSSAFSWCRMRNGWRHAAATTCCCCCAWLIRLGGGGSLHSAGSSCRLFYFLNAGDVNTAYRLVLGGFSGPARSDRRLPGTPGLFGDWRLNMLAVNRLQAGRTGAGGLRLGVCACVPRDAE